MYIFCLLVFRLAHCVTFSIQQNTRHRVKMKNNKNFIIIIIFFIYSTFRIDSGDLAYPLRAILSQVTISGLLRRCVPTNIFLETCRTLEVKIQCIYNTLSSSRYHEGKCGRQWSLIIASRFWTKIKFIRTYKFFYGLQSPLVNLWILSV